MNELLSLAWFADHDRKFSILNTEYKLVQTRYQIYFFLFYNQRELGKILFFPSD